MSRIKFRLQVYVAILLCVITAGTIGFMIVENLSPLDALYFIIVTIATVGFGDIHPLTPTGKILVIFTILAGVGCFVGVAANAIEYMIDEQERTRRLSKMNMIIGVFFSEAGIKLLKKFSAKDPRIDEIRSALLVSNHWSDEDFSRARLLLKQHATLLDSRTVPLDRLHAFLTHHKRFMLTLLENPQLGEHDTFTDLLHAVFHLSEELIARESLTDLPQSDLDHLSGDINRVYGLLVTEWLSYMHYLKKYYPYLFSLAMRTNPFDANATAIIT
jgi:voltage-gated potassium channel